MAEINFKDIELSDSKWIRKLFAVQDFNSEDYNFTYQFLWRKTFKSQIARVDNLILIQYNLDNRRSYLMPVGKAEDKYLADVINSLLTQEKHLTFYGVLPPQMAFLEKYFPGRFSAEQLRMGADYIYDAEALKTLKGKKYQAKRNFANGFRRMFDWRFEPITQSNIAQCIVMNDEWCKRNGCDKDFWKANEFCAVRTALNNFCELGLDGGLLRVFSPENPTEGKIVAFSIGERANSDTVLIHIEKAFTEYRGAYQAMSQEFLAYMDKTLREREGIAEEKPAFSFVNREDDSGDENLRKAKLEYHPIEIKEKYLVVLK